MSQVSQEHTRRFVELKTGETMEIGTSPDSKVQVRLFQKNGQRARLEVVAPPSVLIRQPDRQR